MKKIIIFVFILFINVSFSQSNLFVTYKVKIANEDIFKNNSNLKTLFDKAKKDAVNIKFGLICKKESSHFYHIDNITSIDDNSSFNATSLIFTGYNGEIYQERDLLYSYSRILNNNTYVKSSAKNNWVLKNEVKLIDGFECYKATSEYVVNNIKGEYRHPVIAWYCPKIPYSFGPKGYSGLPGLILELQVRNVTFGIETIEFNSEKKIEINIKKMKILNEEEYEKALDKFNDFQSE
jgi:GLPGLI family protein